MKEKENLTIVFLRLPWCLLNVRPRSIVPLVRWGLLLYPCVMSLPLSEVQKAVSVVSRTRRVLPKLAQAYFLSRS
jgi:hypothetical protein